MQVYVTDAQHYCEHSYEGTFAAAQTLPARSISTFALAD